MSKEGLFIGVGSNEVVTCRADTVRSLSFHSPTRHEITLLFRAVSMGIRFYCPNGHRLHVKEFQAGKRGICPHCDAHFRIPPASEIPKGAPRLRPDDPGPTPVVTRSPETVPAMVGTPGPILPEGSGAVATVPAVSLADPIAEAPAAVWYVRPPSGGQFGPASAEVMQRWLAEGRVSADTLVWREDWPEWLSAGPLFPRLSPATSAESPRGQTPAMPESVPGTIVVPDSPRGRTSATRKKPESRSKSAVALTVTLLSMVLVLLVVLVLVVRGAA